MGKSHDLSQFPHTAPNTEPPKPGDLVFGDEGLFALCFVSPVACTGLLVNSDYTGIVDIPIAEYPTAFLVRVLVGESIREMEPQNHAH